MSLKQTLLIKNISPFYYLALLVLASICSIVGWFIPYYYASADGGKLLALAYSIAHGNGYRNIDTIYNSIHTHFPFGWPMLLSLAYILPFKPAITVHCIASFFLILSTVTLFFMCKNFCNSFLSFIISINFILIPLLAELSQSAFSEIGFCAFLYLSLFIFKKAIITDSPKTMWLAAFAILCTGLVKFNGEILWFAALISLLLHRKNFLFFLPFICIFVFKIGLHCIVQESAWLYENYFITDFAVSRFIFGYFIQLPHNYSTSDSQKIYMDLLQDTILNVKRLCLTFIPLNIFPSLYHSWQMQPLKIIANTGITFVSLYGIIILFFKKYYFYTLTFFLSIAIILTRGNSDAQYRYYSPFAPFFILGICITGIYVHDRKWIPQPILRVKKAVVFCFFSLLIADRFLYTIHEHANSFTRKESVAIQEFETLSYALNKILSDTQSIVSPITGYAFILTQKKCIPFPWKSSNLHEWNTFLKENKDRPLIFPGWWVEMSRFDIVQIDNSLSALYDNGYIRFEYGSKYPTFIYFINTPQNQTLCESLRSELKVN